MAPPHAEFRWRRTKRRDQLLREGGIEPLPPRQSVAGKGGGAAGGEARDMLVVFEAGITGAHVADVTDDEFVMMQASYGSAGLHERWS